ncbi:heme ABC transporter ATP-binding protein [Subtercola endophyticus]|uniref:heme ABC transporter ATP-binding protein n=1 Tax=Subtercola endophyticus TaxID=2895559 RepID=UPI001E628C3C|nr:heme ABC transporter ATP-binding protein [Subtercola endophyticus]UFS58943.1 heme ABC transporter ATP-binding protein [Subtercola endophyticus]
MGVRRRGLPAGAALAAPGPRESDVFGRERPPHPSRSSEGVALGSSAGAVEARGLHVALEGRRILDDVSLSAARGEVHALVGPNGAGKSTLLSVLSGDAHADRGEIRIEGRPLDAWTLRELARHRGVLLQQNAVFFPFTVQQVVEMGRAPWLGTDRDTDDELAVAEALDLTETTAFADRHVPSLSGGERARVAFARVLAQRTGILLLDEPTAALDLRHQEQVLTVARDRARNGSAVVVVLHDLTLAAAYADTVTVLHGGRVAATGVPREVFTADLLSLVYEHEIEVLEHPRSGAPIIQPVR